MAMIRLFIPAGLQHLDGTLALKYARTRHVDNDFGRAQRQQQVILAARDKALVWGLAVCWPKRRFCTSNWSKAFAPI